MKIADALGQARKAVAAAVAAVAVIASTGLLNGTTEVLVNSILAAAGAVIVWLIANDTPAKMIANEQGLADAVAPVVAVVKQMEEDKSIPSPVPYPDAPVAPVDPPVSG